MRTMAEAFVVVSFGFKQLAEMRLAVDVAMQRCIVPQTKRKDDFILIEIEAASVEESETHLSFVLQ